MKHSALIITSLLLVLYGCQKPEIQNKLTVNVPFKEIKWLSADSIFSSVHYIPLETAEKSLFYDIDKIMFSDAKIYILDRKQAAILVFDNKGKFLDKLFKRGNGHGEYLSIEDFVISDSLLYVLSRNNKKVFVYDQKFNYVKSIDINARATNIAIRHADLFVYCNFCSDDEKNIYIFDKGSGALKNKYMDFLKKQKGVAQTSTVFANRNDSVFAFFPYDYSIYHLTKKDREKYLYVDFGEKNTFPASFVDFSADERKEYIKSHYSNMHEIPISRIGNLYLSNDWCYFTFVYSCFKYHFFQNLRTKASRFGYITCTQNYPIIDGPQQYEFVIDDKYVTCIQVEDIKSILEFRNTHNMPSILPEGLVETLKIDDNPVLCIYELKSF